MNLTRFFLAGVIFQFAMVFGMQAVAKELTVQEASSLALDSNLDLKSFRDQIYSLRYKAGQAMAPYNPTLTYTKNNVSGFAPLGFSPNDQTQVTWTVGFPGKAVANSNNLKFQSESVRQNALGKEIDIIVSLLGNYADHASNKVMREFLIEEIKKAEDLIKLQEKRYATGTGAQADILNSRVTLSLLKQSLLSNENDKILLSYTFLKILGVPDKADLSPKVTDDIMKIPKTIPPLATLREYMLKYRPDLEGSRHDLAAAKSALTSAYLGAFPDFQLSAAMNTYPNPNAEAVPGQSRDYTFGVGVTLPIFYPLNDYANVRAANSDRDAAEHKKMSTEISDLSDLNTNYANFNLLTKTVEQMEHVVIPAAKASYDLALKGYSFGRLNFLTLNDARTTYVQTKRDYILNKLQYAKVYYGLFGTVGCDFTKKDGPHACQ